MAAAKIDDRGLAAGYRLNTELEVTPRETAEKLKSKKWMMIDVRTRPEWELSRIPGAVNIPLDELPAKAAGVDPGDAEMIAVLCHHGRRSLQGAEILREAGLAAKSIAGGIEIWALAVDPNIPRYERDSAGCRLVK